MANITKRGNNFRIRVSVGYDVYGKQIVKSTTYTPPENATVGKAEKLAREFASEYEKRCRGLTELKENMRFADLVEWYFENYVPNELKEVTAYTYKGQINNHLMAEFGNTKLKDFSSVKLTAYFKRLTKPNTLETKPLSSTTIRKVYIILQSIFTRAVEQGFIPNTPCKNVILPKDKRQNEDKKPFLDEKQAKVILNMVKGYSKFNTIIKVLLYTGIRSGECLALQWHNIDFDNHTIHIEHNLADVGGKHWLATPKTSNSVRYIGMSEELANILLEHKIKQEEEKQKLGKIYKYHNMVFTSNTGDYVDRSNLNQQFKKFIKDTDFRFASLHTLRHCNATLLINSGIDLKIVSEHLGHCDIGVTANTYADVLASTKAKVADILAFKLK